MPAIMQFHGKDHRGGDIWRVYPDYDRMKPGDFTVYNTEKRAQKAVDEANGVKKPEKTEAEIRASFRVEHGPHASKPGMEYYQAVGGFGRSSLNKFYDTRAEADAAVAKALKAALKKAGY